MSFLNKEFAQLQLEIERIADNTEWNGMKILDGTAGSNAGNGDVVTFHAGANAGQTFTATFGDFETVRESNTIATSAVTHGGDTITINNHGYDWSEWFTPWKVAAAITNLTDGTSYYVESRREHHQIG